MSKEKDKTEKQLFLEMNDKLDKLMKLAAITALHNKSSKEQTFILLDYGFKPAEISKLLGKPLANITSYVSQRKRKE